MKDEGPDRVYINKKDREIYQKLQEKTISPFKGKDNRVLYMLTLALGFVEGERIEFSPGERLGYILLKTLEDEDKAIINAIAVYEKGDLSILGHKKEVYTIADEYAASGIQLLKDEVFGGKYGTFLKKLEYRLIETYKKVIENLE